MYAGQLSTGWLEYVQPAQLVSRRPIALGLVVAVLMAWDMLQIEPSGAPPKLKENNEQQQQY